MFHRPDPPTSHENPLHMVVSKNNSCSNTTVHNWYGRFGNQLMRNICASILAEKYNLKFGYSCYEAILSMGIKLYTEGEKTHPTTLQFKDEYFERFMENNTTTAYIWDGDEEPTPEKHNIDVNYIFLQTPVTARYIRDFINERASPIKQHNPFRERYENNNDVFVHIRLGDIANTNYITPIEYYRNTLIKVLKDPQYYNGERYISSDTIDHPMCQSLIQQFNMIPFLLTNEITTIQYASTCSNLILSTGTFSWVIGLLGFHSNVYYPEIRVKWHGDIFIFEDWKKEPI
jgi:hypothetical protein